MTLQDYLDRDFTLQGIGYLNDGGTQQQLPITLTANAGDYAATINGQSYSLSGVSLNTQLDLNGDDISSYRLYLTASISYQTYTILNGVFRS